MTKSDSILELTNQANDLCRRGDEAIRQSLIYFKQCGDCLREIKRRTTHGNWEKWLAENFVKTPNHARNYMRLSKQWDEIEPLLDDDPDLALRTALKQISKPRKTAWDKKPFDEEVAYARSEILNTLNAMVRRTPDEDLVKLHRTLDFAFTFRHWNQMLEAAELFHDDQKHYARRKALRRRSA